MELSAGVSYCLRVVPEVRLHRPQTAFSQIAQTYLGVEGFYWLNQKGELGYITGKSPRLAKEKLGEYRDNEFLKRYPSFKQEVRAFQPFLVDLYESYPSTPQMELGYVVPSDNSHSWNTATLVMHEHIVRLMQETVRQAVKERTITFDEADRRLCALTPERGVYQGFDALFNHVSTLGGQPFFPVLYYCQQPQLPGSEQIAPLRVINIKYVNPESGNTAQFEAVYSLLRSKLAARGTLDPSRRFENRFTLERELDLTA